MLPVNKTFCFGYNRRLLQWSIKNACEGGLALNSLSMRLDVVWYNNSWLGFLKTLNYVPKEKNDMQILKLVTYSKLKINILGLNWQFV